MLLEYFQSIISPSCSQKYFLVLLEIFPAIEFDSNRSSKKIWPEIFPDSTTINLKTEKHSCRNLAKRSQWKPLDLIAQYGASYLIPPDRPQFITNYMTKYRPSLLALGYHCKLSKKNFMFQLAKYSENIAETLKHIKMH